MRDFKSTIISIICGIMIGSTGAYANSAETKLDELITDGRSSCDGSFTLLDGAVERIDLNLNGEVDLVVLDAGGFSCTTARSQAQCTAATDHCELYSKWHAFRCIKCNIAG